MFVFCYFSLENTRTPADYFFPISPLSVPRLDVNTPEASLSHAGSKRKTTGDNEQSAGKNKKKKEKKNDTSRQRPTRVILSQAATPPQQKKKTAAPTRKAAPKDRTITHIGSDVTRTVLNPTTGKFLRFIHAKVIRFFPQTSSGACALWRIRHVDGDEEDLDARELKQGMALFARIARHEAEDMAKEKIEFAQKNQWRMELLKQALSENFAHLTARVASKLLEGWTVGAASKSVARTTVRYESPDGDYFRSTLEVVRHFAGMVTKDEELNGKNQHAGPGRKRRRLRLGETDELPLPKKRLKQPALLLKAGSKLVKRRGDDRWWV